MLQQSDMTGMVAIVTGAGSGLGRATALRLGDLGADLAIVDISAEGLAATAETLRGKGRKVLELALNLTDRANCSAVIDRTVAEFGRIDALCNVAEIGRAHV